MKKPTAQGRPPTRAEKAALDRAFAITDLTLAYAEMIKLALRGKEPQALRRELKRMRQILRGELPPT